MALPVDGEGQKIAEDSPLPLLLDFSPYFVAPSPDGHYLFVARPSEPGFIPYIFDIQSTQLWPLFKGNPHISGEFFGWHPDSRQVLFWRLDVALWLIDVESGESTILAMIDGPVQGAALSPDGQNAVFMTAGNEPSETLWRVSTAGGDARPLFKPGGVSYVFGWSPDGSRILYTGEVGAGILGGPLWLTEPDGQDRYPLSGSFLFGWGFQPVWSPDGQWIAFTGQEKDQDFGCLKRGGPPDPEKCLFEGTAIYIENIVTGEIRRLALGIEPVWSPDGSMLAFISDQGGAVEIWTVRIDGTGLQQLTADGQPKGLRLAWFQTGR
ncbi:MAG: PD40 domain-containing protein [Chloroflexi bacterium]|nr:PD40 domain-containing protein [Chloroflexota bacterium]